VCENVSLWFNTFETMLPPSNVMSCWIESALVHTTVAPAVTVTVAGENAKFLMVTASVATGVDAPAVWPPDWAVMAMFAMLLPAADLPPPPIVARTITATAKRPPIVSRSDLR